MDDLIKSLNINGTVLLASSVLFVTLVVVMDRLFWRRVMAHLDQRRQEITRAYEAVETTCQQLDELHREYDGRLVRIEADARARIQQTVRDAQAQRDRLIADAREEAARTVSEGAAGMERQHSAVLAGMREQLAGVSLETLERVVGRKPDPEQHRLVDEFIAQRT